MHCSPSGDDTSAEAAVVMVMLLYIDAQRQISLITHLCQIRLSVILSADIWRTSCVFSQVHEKTNIWTKQYNTVFVKCLKDESETLDVNGSGLGLCYIVL